MREEDLDAADRVMRLAFGTFLGLPDPLTFMGDADYVRTRWIADPSASFVGGIEQGFGWLQFRNAVGERGLFRPADDSSRPVGPRNRAAVAWAYDGSVRPLANSPFRIIHVCCRAPNT